MTVWVVIRHYVGEQNTLNEYQEGAQRILATKDMIQQKKLDINLGVKVTAAENSPGITSAMRQTIYKINGELASANVFCFYDPRDRGSGTSFSQMMDNSTCLATPSPTIVVGHDIDQFPLGSPEYLDCIVDFTNQIVADNSLWSPGSKSVEVKLGIHPRNSNLRIIHELFNSRSIGSEKLRIPGDVPDGVLDGYREIGESTPGFHVLNFSHPNFPILAERIFRYGSLLGTDFGSEYYTAIKASTLGRISPRYVPTLPNKYYVQKGETDEFEGVKKFIGRAVNRLGKTDIGDMLRKTVADDTNVDAVSQYYDRSDVKLVQQWMQEALQ